MRANKVELDADLMIFVSSPPTNTTPYDVWTVCKTEKTTCTYPLYIYLLLLIIISSLCWRRWWGVTELWVTARKAETGEGTWDSISSVTFISTHVQMLVCAFPRSQETMLATIFLFNRYCFLTLLWQKHLNIQLKFYKVFDFLLFWNFQTPARTAL